ncbi:MAG: isopeptide-forming domain-containing fimbrial protein, partial [Ruminococcus sp.]|nr:isopeptide-forming domain-containing fimbrial protein [Ruminococcus sp.]
DDLLKKYFTDENCKSASDVTKILGTAKDEAGQNVFADDSDATKQFVEIVAKNIQGAGSEMSGLEVGYYLVVDSAAPTISDGGSNSGAKSRYMVKLAGKDVTITAKHAAPKVDKQVWDNTDGDDEEHWGETADHNINETFQFRLVATLGADDEYAAYDTYKISFTDTLAKGVVFDSIESVKVNDTVVPVYDETNNKNGYYTEAEADLTGGSWNLTIADIKEYDKDLTDGSVIEVIYNAHLSEDAMIADANENEFVYGENSKANINKVKLTYSNNPNWEGRGDKAPDSKDEKPKGPDDEKEEGDEETGETPEDTVGVYTYQANGTKIDGDTGSTLAGAEFKLYDAKTGGNEIGLYKGKDGAYYPVKDSTETPVEIETDDSGVILIKGLDAGTYYLEETKQPTGYNKLTERAEIKIGVTSHLEKTSGENEEGESNNVSLTFDKSNSNADFEIANNKGTSLPTTGGIGTTLFYLGGGAMVAVAGVFLITKKRMKKEEL